MKSKKPTKIVYRKLGREQADGLAYKDYNEIHIDKRLKGKNYLLTLIHELGHIHLPHLTEEAIEEFSVNFTRDLLNCKKIKIIDE